MVVSMETWTQHSIRNVSSNRRCLHSTSETRREAPQKTHKQKSSIAQVLPAPTHSPVLFSDLIRYLAKVLKTGFISRHHHCLFSSEQRLTLITFNLMTISN